MMKVGVPPPPFAGGDAGMQLILMDAVEPGSGLRTQVSAGEDSCRNEHVPDPSAPGTPPLPQVSAAAPTHSSNSGAAPGCGQVMVQDTSVNGGSWSPPDSGLIVVLLPGPFNDPRSPARASSKSLTDSDCERSRPRSGELTVGPPTEDAANRRHWPPADPRARVKLREGDR